MTFSNIDAMRPKHSSGFTLVELAIAMVIIGLFVGGILTGRDLIKGAQINNIMIDIEAYNAAAMTYATKFGGLPGDLKASRVSKFGMTARSGLPGQGDGNKLIEGCASGEAALGCETALFWIDLAQSELIGLPFVIGTSIADGNSVAVSVTDPEVMESYIPPLSIRNEAFLHVYPEDGRNYYLIGNLNTDASGDITFPSNGALTPEEASQLDLKTDDGYPQTGKVRAVSAIATDGTGSTIDPGASPAAAGQCVDTTLSDPSYNTVTGEFSGELNCNVRYLSSF